MADSIVSPTFAYNVSSGAQKNPISIHKFGRASVSTTFVPVAFGGVYQTPQVSGATQLRIAAGNINDASAGSGARKILLEGLDASGNILTEEITTAGTGASSATAGSFFRLYRASVSESGTYATSSAGSHAANIVIENSAGGTTWATIDSSGFPRSRSEIGAYTVPLGYFATISSVFVSIQDTKTVSVLAFSRAGVLKTSAPYDAMKAFIDLGTISGEEFVTPATPFGPFYELTDIVFMGKLETGGGTAEVDVEFEILLEKVSA